MILMRLGNVLQYHNYLYKMVERCKGSQCPHLLWFDTPLCHMTFISWYSRRRHSFITNTAEWALLSGLLSSFPRWLDTPNWCAIMYQRAAFVLFLACGIGMYHNVNLSWNRLLKVRGKKNSSSFFLESDAIKLIGHPGPGALGLRLAKLLLCKIDFNNISYL